MLAESKRSSEDNLLEPRNGISFLDYYLIKPKLLYLTMNMAVYSCYLFGFVFVQNKWSISTEYISLLNIITAISFFSSLLWSFLVDRTGRLPQLLVLAAFGFAFSFSLFLCSFLPKSFIIVVLIYGSTSFFLSGMFPLMENAVFVLLKQSPFKDYKNLYGRQRLWGAIGQAIIGLSLGKLIGIFDYYIIFVSAAFFCLLFSVFVLLFVRQSIEPSEGISKPPNDNRSGEAKKKSKWAMLLLDVPFLVFLILVFFGGFGRAIVGNNLPFYLSNYFKVKSFGLGTAFFIRVFPEILCFAFSKEIIQFIGPNSTFFVALLMGALRLGIFSYLPIKPKFANFAISAELIKGINNALLITSSTMLAYDMAPNGTASLAQGLLVGVHGNLATAFAGLAAFIILKVSEHQAYPIVTLFRFTFYVSLFSLLLHFVFRLSMSRSKSSIRKKQSF